MGHPGIPPSFRAARPRTLAELPGPRGAALLGGDADPGRLHLVLEAWAREFGPLFRFRLPGKRFLVVSDPALVCRLLRDRPEALRRGARLARALEEGGVRGVFTAEGEDWRLQRKFVMRALTPEIIHRFFPRLAAHTERLRRRWLDAARAGRPVDLLRDLKAFTLDITIALALGHDSNNLEQDDPLLRDISFLFDGLALELTAPGSQRRGPDSLGDPAAASAFQRVHDTILRIVAAARRRLEAEPALRASPRNMLEAMVAACDEPGSRLNDEHVVGNALTMVFGGEDTTSHSLAWMAWFLAGDPDAAARAREQSLDVLAGALVLEHYGDLARLGYLDAAARETMRLKPVVPVIVLEPHQDMLVDDVEVPAGTTIMCLLRPAPEHGGGDACFRPERWLAEAAGSNPPQSHPFGAGPRFCPGRYLAMAEIKAVISMLVTNFELSLARDAVPVEERYGFTMKPDSLPVVLHPRAGLSRELERTASLR